MACIVFVGCTARAAGDGEGAATGASGDASQADGASDHGRNDGPMSEDDMTDFPWDGGEDFGSFLGCCDMPVDECRTIASPPPR